MITAAEAKTLIDALKESVRTDIFEWLHATPQEEKFIEAANDKNRFILHLKRNPFEIRLHFRSLDRHVDLMRIDAARRHLNPDGTEIIGQPHLHVFREGYERLPWAEPIDWMDLAPSTDHVGAFPRRDSRPFPSGLPIAFGHLKPQGHDHRRFRKFHQILLSLAS